MVNVPCNGCTRCCHGDAIRLLPGDDHTLYEIEPHQSDPKQLMLAHKPNGDCIYLGHEGCSIHETKPIMCKTMDCRLIAENITYTQARKMKNLPFPIWQKGKELLKQ